MSKNSMRPLSSADCFYKKTNMSLSNTHYMWIMSLLARFTAKENSQITIETICVDDDFIITDDETRKTNVVSTDDALEMIKTFVDEYNNHWDLSMGHISYDSGCVNIVFEYHDFVYGRRFVALRAYGFIRNHDIHMAEKEKLETNRALARKNRTVDDEDDISFHYQLFD